MDETKKNIKIKGRKRYVSTGITNLKREANSGVYYLLAKINGKFYRSSLKTEDLLTAQKRFEQKIAQIRAVAPKKRTDLTIEAEFNDTAMWRLFIQKTAPELLEQLARLNKNLEKRNGKLID